MSRVTVLSLIFGGAGLLIPLLVLAARAISPTEFSPAWIYYIWPTYFFLGGMGGSVDGLTGAYVLVSILLNAAIYFYIGSVIARLFSPKKAQPPTAK